MDKITVLELDFKDYTGAKLPSSFQYVKADEELAEFYNEEAAMLQKESITKIIDVFYKRQLIAYYAFTVSEINFKHLKPEDKIAPFAHPAIKLGRLLVCNSLRKKGVGTAILQHLAKQAIDIREKMPLRFLFVDALPHAVQFYVKNGFIDSNIKRGKAKDLSLLYIDLNRVLPKLE